MKPKRLAEQTIVITGATSGIGLVTARMAAKQGAKLVLVAEAILHCAENPTRDFFVGGMAKVHSSMALNASRLHEKMNESVIDYFQNSGERAKPNRRDGLYDSNSRLRERGVQDRFVLEHSLYQKAKLHPALTATIAVAGGVALAAWLGSRMSATHTHYA